MFSKILALATVVAGEAIDFATSVEGKAWPDCIEQSTVIRNNGKALFTNVSGYGAAAGCFLDDCKNTDKFGVTDLMSCVNVCHTIESCKFWVFGVEEGMTKCWVRTDDSGREAGDGWSSGSRTCMPADVQKLIEGNDECWVDGFDYGTCCEPKFGPNGNTQCWDGMFNYNRCCFPRNDL